MTTTTPDDDQNQTDPAIAQADQLVEEAEVLATAPAVEYEVRLCQNLTAASPHDAAMGYIDTILRFGLDGFVYRVKNLTTGEAWIVKGDETMTVDEFLAMSEELGHDPAS